MDPDLAGFIGLAALMIALVAWLRADMNGRMDRLETAHAERFGRIETAQAEQGAMLSEHGAMLSGIGECLTRIEAMLSEHGERMARVEGAVAGALGRPFPELMTHPADAAVAAE